MRPIKIAIHLHTHYSYDSNLPPAALVAAARRAGLDCVAITDHDEIDGALEARAVGGLRVIVGEEISTADGHLLGLFLEQRIPPGLSAEETAAEIRAQGGVVLAPHPFCTLCNESLQAAMWRLVEQLDGVEVYNAQNPLPWEDTRAAEFAQRTGLPVCVGMDAHLRWLPATYQVMPDFTDAQSFLRALSQAELLTGRVGLRYYALMGFRQVWSKLFPWPPAGFGVKVPRRAEIDAQPGSRPLVQPTRLG
ncbi:MAG: PHP domain-containing protein [Phycisphaerae bacterium]